MQPMLRLLLPALVLLFLVGCGRSSPKPAAQEPAAPAKIEVQENAKPAAPATLAEQLNASAPSERPAEPPYERVVPGMATADIVALLGKPDDVRERGARATLHWRVGGKRDPVFIVWTREGVAHRMRFVDSW